HHDRTCGSPPARGQATANADRQSEDHERPVTPKARRSSSSLRHVRFVGRGARELRLSGWHPAWTSQARRLNDRARFSNGPCAPTFGWGGAVGPLESLKSARSHCLWPILSDRLSRSLI